MAKQLSASPVDWARPSAREMLSGRASILLLVDNQHGVWTDETTATIDALVPSRKATPMVRVSWNDFWRYWTAAGSGCNGVVVPMVNSVEEASAAAIAARFPPQGGPFAGGLLPSTTARITTCWSQRSRFSSPFRLRPFRLSSTPRPF